jgi:acyl carrier protein
MELLEASVLDSMGIFQLVSYIESEFGVEVRDEDLVPERFNTINDIVALVESLRSGNVA